MVRAAACATFKFAGAIGSLSPERPELPRVFSAPSTGEMALPRRNVSLTATSACAALLACSSSADIIPGDDGSWRPAFPSPDPPNTYEWEYRRVCVAAQIDAATLRRGGEMNLDYQRSYTFALRRGAGGWLSARNFSRFDPERPQQERLVESSATGLNRSCRDPLDIRILAQISSRSREHYRIVARLSQNGRSISRTVERRSHDEWLPATDDTRAPGLAGGVSAELEQLAAALLDQT